jgi:predicted GH43/DUF377 family glycosyl hydrolase
LFSNLEKIGVIVKRGMVGEFDSGMVESPAVWYDDHFKKFGMVYVGYKLIEEKFSSYTSVANPKVGLAWSNDLANWTKDKRNPIFEGSGILDSSDSNGVSGPFIWYENKTYYLFYFGVTDVGYEKGKKTLNVATSNDLINWTQYKNNPIIVPFGNSFRRDAIWHPNVVKNENQYFLFFNASGIYNGIKEEFIGYAVSDNLLNWEVDDNNSPILVGSGKNGSWDSSYRAGDPSVFKYKDKWYMTFYSWDNIHTQDGIAITTEENFPLGWKVYENNPILKLGKHGTFDALHAGKPFSFLHKNNYYHFYTAVDDSENREIALAIGKL